MMEDFKSHITSLYQTIDPGCRELKEETKLVGDGNKYINSLDRVEIMFLAEEDLGVSISDEEVKSVQTYGDLVKLVESKKC